MDYNLKEIKEISIFLHKILDANELADKENIYEGSANDVIMDVTRESVISLSKRVPQVKFDTDLYDGLEELDKFIETHNIEKDMCKQILKQYDDCYYDLLEYENVSLNHHIIKSIYEYMSEKYNINIKDDVPYCEKLEKLLEEF